MENRDIKFRGKRKDNGEWVYGDLIHMKGSSKMLIDRTPSNPKDWKFEDVVFNDCLIATMNIPNRQGWDYGDCIRMNKVIPSSVGQYARKDNFENELYEFDIIERTINAAEPETKTIEIVCFRDAGFVSIQASKYANNSPEDWICLQDYLYHSIKKIGNTFDNPELIK